MVFKVLARCSLSAFGSITSRIRPELQNEPGGAGQFGGLEAQQHGATLLFADGDAGQGRGRVQQGLGPVGAADTEAHAEGRGGTEPAADLQGSGPAPGGPCRG